MDLSSIGHHIRKTDLLNRSGVTLFLIALLSLIAVYYSEAVDHETERSALMSNLGRYESVLQVEVQHLVDLIYRSSNQAFSPDTPAIANSFPWVRSIGQISKTETDVPKKNHLLTLSLAEVSQSLGGQITFATVNNSDVLLVLSRAGRDQTIRAVFSTARLLEFINGRVNQENLDVGINLSPADATTPGNGFAASVHLGLPGLEFPVVVARSPGNDEPTKETTSLAWIMIIALWMIWFLLFFERRRRLAHLDLIREQKERIEAQASRSTLAEITSSLGHEINQPVAAIESLADTAGILVESGDRLEAGRTLRRIQSEAIRVGQIIQTIRRLSSSEGLTFETQDLNKIILEIEPFAKIICKQASLTVNTDPSQERIEVYADRTALEQIITNLLTNASEALERDRSGSDRKPQITLSLSSTDQTAMVKVTDNGCGVPTDIREDIFNSFVTSKREGVGLGLNLSRSIAEKHHGWLDLVETGSTGTTFELRLPLMNH